MFENLERRQLLSTYYVNDNWVVTTDNNAPGLDAGDEVANTGFGDNSSFTGLIFGTDAFSTISGALGVATSPGDIIRVISGTYSGTTTVTGANAGVLLRGDNFGTAGTGVRVTETILNGSGGSLVINAANVQVDGFTIRDAAVGAGTGVTVGAVAGVQIKNNIITDNSVGVEFGAGSSNFTVDRNKVDANNRAGVNRGQGVRVLANTGTGTITNNSFTGHGNFSSTGAVSLVGSSSVAVGTVGNGNTFGTNAVAVRTYAGTTGTTLVGNTFAATNTTYINHAGATELNAAANTFDGVSPSGNNNIVQQNAIVDKIIDGVDVSGRGLVRINAGQVYVTANSFNTGLGTTTPDIQRAVDVSVASDTVHIQGATYTGNVNTSTKTVTLTPTPGTTQVTINGSVVFDSSDTLLLEINGLVAGTGYDQLIVNGTVTLGGVNLATTGSTVVAAPGNQITLIDNNMADAVVGSFNGLLNGANVTVNAQPFVVFYNGGTGNDVVLVRVPAAAPPAVVYVDDNWVSAVNGVDQDGVGGGTAFGFDQFADIQSAIDAVAAGGTIHVAAGQYIQNVVVDKGVSILGPNSAIAGNGVRVGEAVVRPETSQPDPFTDPASVVFYITSSGVTIKGLTIDGDNTSLTSGVVKGGADIDAVDGIASYEGVGNITIQNNIVRNTAYTGINFDNVENGGAATSGNVISFNLIQNIGDGGTSGSSGISVASNFYANILNNEINDAVIGIQTGNFSLANPGAAVSIADNEIAASRIGLWVNDHFSAASTMTVDGNTITAIDDAVNFNYWTGIMLSSIRNAVDVTITDNDIDGSASTNESYGYEVWNTPTSAVLSLEGGTVSGVEFGVFVNNYDSFGANAGNTKATISGVDITASNTGVWVYDSPANSNGATVTATISGGTEIQSAGVGIGIVVDGSGATATVGGSNIHDNIVGVSVINASVATISGNQIHDNDGGVNILSTASGNEISENLFSANGDQDVYVGPAVTATGVEISGNSFESAVAVMSDSAAVIQASGNWWGTTSNPFSAGKITGSGDTGVDYSPWLFTSVDLDSNPANGFQPLLDVLGVDDDSPQSSYLSAAPTRIAEGILLLEDGGQLVIYSGSYTEDLNTSSKSVAISIDDSTAQITIDGDVILDANDVLLIDAGGTNPLTDYDNIIVTGTADLGDAVLITTIGYVPGPSDVLTIINSSSIVGTFDSLPQGAFIGSGFRIDYLGGTADVRFVQNTPFVVAEANGPYGINEGQSVTLSSAGSFDPDALLGDVIVSYAWDLNNDNVYGDVMGANPTVSWATLQSFGINDGNASYTIRLRVTNNLGETGTDTSTITVTNVTPTIAVTGSATSNEGSTYSLTLGSVIDPGADTISSYRINWGDGNIQTYTPAQVLLAAGVLKHVYTDDNPTATLSDPYTIAVDLQDEDNSPSYYASVTSKTITVNNVAPTPTIVGAPANSPEGTSISLSVNPNDPGADGFSYSWVVTKGVTTYATGNSASITFTPDDGPSSFTVSVTVTDDDGGSNTAVSTIAVTNVAPTIAVTGANTSDEGSVYTVTLGAITDPGLTDTVTDYFINWGDGSAVQHYTTAQVILAGGVFTHVFDDGPQNRTINVTLQDEDGLHPGAGLKVVQIGNLDPTGTLTNGGPVNQSENGLVTWLSPSDPSTNDASNLLFDYDFNSDGTYDLIGSPLSFATVPGSYLTTVGPHTITSRMRDNDGLLADGAARDGVVVQTTIIMVNAATFRVLPGGFVAKPSGFTVQFNKPAQTAGLNLYDGDDILVDLPDVLVIGASNPGNPVRGSLVWDAGTNTATWVATGGVLANDTYTVTLVSGANGWTAGGADTLDGNADGTNGDNFTQNFVVSSSTRVVSLPDFARGSGQSVSLPLANTPGGTLPISVSNAAGVTSVDFQLYYNPQLLDITGIAKAAGVPGDWSITTNTINISATLRQINITVSGVTALGAGNVPVVALTANVPNAAAYGDTNLMRIENVVVNGVGGRGDYAIHKNVYVGDATGNGVYTGADSALISGVVVGPTTGFDVMGLIDPTIIADVDANGLLQGQDASWVAQKSILPAMRPEIPDNPGLVLTLGTGVDPTIDVADNVAAGPGANDVVVGVNITDSAEGLKGFNLHLVYDTTKLSLTDGLSSPDVTLGTLFTNAGGWSMVSYVNEAAGTVDIAFWRADAMPASTGTFLNLNFDVAPAAAGGATAITPSGLANDGGLSFTHVAGSILIDATGPAAPTSSFNFDDGVPMNVTFTWAENVSGPKTLTLTNLTTNTVVPVTLVYNPNTGTYTFPSFAAGILPNGNYQGVINAASVTDQWGNPMAANAVINFFVLAGDANRDRLVNIQDLVILSNNWMQAGTFTDGDFNYDGIVDSADLGILSLNWQQTVAPPLAPALASPTAPVATSAPTTAQPARTAARKPTRVIDLVQ